jgi:hypothetical protein
MMDKHRKPKRGGPSLPVGGHPPGEQRAQVQALIDSGKTREAVELAKAFFKETRTLDAEGLLVDAYGARIGALVVRGLADEARALAARVRERFPAQRGRLEVLPRQTELMFSGNLPRLLTELATADAAGRRELETVLARELPDPRLVAESAALPDADPLKVGARAVADLFSRVTSGPLPDGALGRLDGISRRSPLAPWKLLIRAIDAFYRRADSVALANLSAVPADTRPGRLVPVLRCLLGESPTSSRRPLAVSRLLEKVSGGRAVVGLHLERLRSAIAAGDRRGATAAFQDLLAILPSSDPGFARACVVTVLTHWFRSDLDPVPIFETVLRNRRDRETIRLVALAWEHAGLWSLAIETWHRYLASAIQVNALPATGREVAGVLLHMAELFPCDPGEVLEFFDVESEAELRELIRARVLPDCFDRQQLLERARAAEPSPRVFRALVAHHESRRSRQAEAEADAWRRAHPQDLEPLLYLMRAAERRGADRKALELLAAAAALNPLHPEVRQGRFRLLRGRAERRIREGKLELAARDLEQLEREPRANEGDRAAYLQGLRWAAARQAGDEAAAGELERGLAARAGNPVFLELLLGSVAATCAVVDPGLPRPRSQPEAIAGLARAFDLFDALGCPLTVPPELFRQIEAGLSGAPAAELLSLCACGLKLGRPGLTYVAAGRGLADEGPLFHRFLLARGRALSLAGGEWERQRAWGCLRAARELARRARDMDAVRDASAALDSLPAPSGLAGLLAGPFGGDDQRTPDQAPTSDEVAAIVAAERRTLAMPDFGASRARSGRRRRPRRRRRGLLDQLIRLLQETES